VSWNKGGAGEVVAGAMAAVVATGILVGATYASPAAQEVTEWDQAPAAIRIYEGSAVRTLDRLAIKGRAPGNDYDRPAQFGEDWAFDFDRNGCDTRNDILKRDMVSETFDGCLVMAGVLNDKYSGETIEFVRGVGTSNKVQIDHVVALKDAWVKGAQQIDPQQRVNLANDPLNLMASKGTLNQQKGAGDAATWLPPNKGFRCEYVAHQVAVKAKYGLWVTQAEHDAILQILGTCPGQGLPQ
jgi:hypothetical protein